jgi:lipid-A-disaccharide synthase
MKYFLIAGEASGDLHASRLMEALKEVDAEADFRYMGGDLMAARAPGRILHYKETSFMFLDVLLHLGKIYRSMRLVREEIRSWEPDVVIPVDYPGFNLRMARFAHGLGRRVYYYITPKVWAWKERRVRSLKSFVRRRFVILPFEVEWYRQRGVEVDYFGNPLVDGREDFLKEYPGTESFREEHGLDERPIVALLAGSRTGEISRMLPVMVRIAATRPAYQFVVAGAPSMEEALYASFLEGSPVRLVHDATYALLAASRAALVTSGTATLETAIFGVPQVVLYRTSRVAYGIARHLVDVPFISLVNLILGRELVKEVIQKDLYVESERELSRILDDSLHREAMLEGYRELTGKLGKPGVSRRIAGRMVECLNADKVQ